MSQVNGHADALRSATDLRPPQRPLACTAQSTQLEQATPHASDVGPSSCEHTGDPGRPSRIRSGTDGHMTLGRRKRSRGIAPVAASIENLGDEFGIGSAASTCMHAHRLYSRSAYALDGSGSTSPQPTRHSRRSGRWVEVSAKALRGGGFAAGSGIGSVGGESTRRRATTSRVVVSRRPLSWFGRHPAGFPRPVTEFVRAVWKAERARRKGMHDN